MVIYYLSALEASIQQGPFPLGTLGENPFLASSLAAAPAFLHLWPHHSNLCLRLHSPPHLLRMLSLITSFALECNIHFF